MKFTNSRAIGLIFFLGAYSVSSAQKTIYPVKVSDGQEENEPYRFNGVVMTEDARGSGFCAWNSKTFFSAAHVVFDDGAGKWGDPPVWYPRPNWLVLNEATAIQSRGYYRWSSYANLVMDPKSSNLRESFSRDVILGFAFKNLISRTPAKLNRRGSTDLKYRSKTLITGYPAENFYTGAPIDGYSLYATGPALTRYHTYLGKSLQTTLVTTGHGNSGGPIWTQNANSSWSAAGVLVGGLPSETVVYAFSGDISSLTRAVSPVVNSIPAVSVAVDGVSCTSRFFSNSNARAIPDGAHKWTDFPIEVTGFEKGSSITGVKLSLEITTPHQGDLQVMLTAPGGAQALIHNETGGGIDNLIVKDLDISENVQDIDPNGTWKLRVQDRLRGDIATFKFVQLELLVEDAAVTPPAPEP